MILTPLQKLPQNIKDWGKLIVAKGFKKLPKVQNIAQSGHTAAQQTYLVISSDAKLLIVTSPALFTFISSFATPPDLLRTYTEII